MEDEGKALGRAETRKLERSIDSIKKEMKKLKENL